MKSYIFLVVSVICLQNFLDAQYTSDYHPKIVGGNDAKEGQFPHQVSLQNENGHFCGGAIISNKHIVTAAHCVQGVSANLVGVLVGTNKLNQGGERYSILRIIVHPSYNSHLIINDIAIICVNGTIKFSINVQPIELNNKLGAKDWGYFAIVSGWGRISYPGPISNHLQSILVRIVNTLDCPKVANIIPPTEKNICALPKKGQGACHGDSGGPLIYNGTLIGIVSWGKPCAKGYPDVYTRIFYFIKWIIKAIKECHCNSSSDSGSGSDSG